MISEFLNGFGALIGYFVLCVPGVLLIRHFVRVPAEVFRKTLHFILLISLAVLVYAFETWWLSALAAVLFIVVVFPILAFAERFEGFSDLLTERKQGELKRSLILAFGMFAVIVSICWGWLGDKMLVLACIFAWGFGDAAAALVGKQFGRRILEGRFIEGRKSVEGSLAMFVVSFLSVLVILLIRGGLPWHGLIAISAITAAVTTIVELYTRNGHDTITCPLAATAVMIPLLWLWGGVFV